MKISLLRPFAALIKIAGLAAWCIPAYAQTSPEAQPIPFSFSSVAAPALPAGIAVHRFGTTSAAIPTSRTTSPGNADLPYNPTANSGGWLSAGSAGTQGIGVLASGSNAAGAIVLSLNTEGKTGLVAKWKARTILQQTSRDNSLALQYRIGGSGNFVDLGDASHVYSTTGKAAGDSAVFSMALPAILEEKALIQLRWVYWESAGSAGSRDRIALDDVLIEESVAGPDVTPPAVISLTPANNAVSVPTAATPTITFSEIVVRKTGSFTIKSLADNSVQIVDIQSASVEINGAAVSVKGLVLAYSTSYSITLTDGAFADAAGNTFSGIADAWTFTTAAPAGTITRISDIQGSGALAASTGEHTIEGVVTHTFLGAAGLNGFYVQEEDADQDGDPLTSEAIFVYNVAADPAGILNPAQGAKVRLTGQVIDFVSTTSGVTTRLTEMKDISAFENLGNTTLPTPVQVQLPVGNVADLERYEGMLVTVSAASGNLTVTEFFELGRYGQVLLSVDGPSNQPGTDSRLDQFTQFNAPSTSGYAAYQAELARRQIILDDGSTRQNPDPIIFGRGGMPLSASNTLRGGDQVATIVGILDERLEGYRIQSATGVNFQPANPRPSEIPSLSTSGTQPTLIVGSANVLNYFVDLDISGDDYRGANTAAEFQRQKTKIVKALIGSGADVIGLMEIQSNGSTPASALQDLVDGMNADPEGSGSYAFIDPATTGTTISTDVIMVGIIYKSDKVTPQGNAATLTNSSAFDLVGRRPLAQTFTQNSTGEVFTVVVNHFKSKGSSSGGVADADAGDGQGFSNGTRSRQATDLANWLATRPTGTTDPDYLILGDLNAYAKEDPMTILETAGYQNLLPAESYSYVFDGQFGSLDHALANATLAKQVTGSGKWHINADEPSVLDYNTEFKSPGQVTGLYHADHFRSADHDPVLVGLMLDKALPVTYIAFTGRATAGMVQLQWSTSQETDNEGFEVLRSENGRNFHPVGYVSGKATTKQQSSYSFEDLRTEYGKTYYYRLRQKDFSGNSELSRVIAVKIPAKGANHVIYPNPATRQFQLSAAGVDKASIAMFGMSGMQVEINVTEAESRGHWLIAPKHAPAPGLYHVNFKTSAGAIETAGVLIY